MSSEPKDRGFVVVTGTSTGIGAATALDLAEQGLHVFAGVRRDGIVDEVFHQPAAAAAESPTMADA